MSPRARRPDRLFDAIAEDRALPSERLEDPEDAAALRAAIELRSAAPGADEPSQAFLAELRRQLAEAGDRAANLRVSRRSLLARTGVAAAGAVAAAAAGVAIDRTLLEPTGPSADTIAAELDPDDGQWTAVVTAAELSPGTARRFEVPGIVGFVSATTSGYSAVSGACTHLGCLLQQNAAAGRLDCPCHRTAFSYDGHVEFSQLPTPPAPLPQLRVRQHGGAVEVLVPKPI